MYRVAILGYRAQGSRHHAPAFDRLEDCEIAAVCDVVEERAQEGSARYGVPCYTDYVAMLDREHIDIVDIPVGERYRYELVMECLRREKHVFTEKPLAGEKGQYRIGLSDVPKAKEMVDAWQGQKVYFGVCFGLHASPNVQRVREVIRSGALGEFKQVQARAFQGTWNHLIDLVRFLCGDVAEVFAYSDDDELGNKACSLKFVNGAVGTIATSNNMDVQFQVKWVGEEGEATIDNIAGTATWRSRGARDMTEWSETNQLIRRDYGSIFDGLIEEFVACVREERSFVADGWAGLRHVEIDGAITESIETGKPIAVNRYQPEMGHTILTFT